MVHRLEQTSPSSTISQTTSIISFKLSELIQFRDAFVNIVGEHIAHGLLTVDDHFVLLPANFHESFTYAPILP